MDSTVRTLQRTTTPYSPGSSSYTVGPATQFLQQAENSYVTQWNERIEKTLSARGLSPVPSTFIGPIMLMEEEITGLQTKRYALPLDEVWWESSSSGTPEGSESSSVASKRKSSSGSSVESVAGSRRRYRRSSTSAGSGPPSPLTAEEKAVRQMARLCFSQMVDSLELCVREANNIVIDDWDRWFKDLMYNWNEAGGVRGGECIEYGCWYGQKRAKPAKVRPLGVGSA